MNINASANENIMKGANSRKMRITTPTHINTLLKNFLIFFINPFTNYIRRHFSFFIVLENIEYNEYICYNVPLCSYDIRNPFET